MRIKFVARPNTATITTNLRFSVSASPFQDKPVAIKDAVLPKDNSRIVGGEFAAEGEFPWQVRSSLLLSEELYLSMIKTYRYLVNNTDLTLP